MILVVLPSMDCFEKTINGETSELTETEFETNKVNETSRVLTFRVEFVEPWSPHATGNFTNFCLIIGIIFLFIQLLNEIG